MWIAHAYVAVIVACSNPGPGQACSGAALEGFISRESCELAVGKIVSLMDKVRDSKIAVRVDAECVAVVPDKEA